MDFFSQLIRIEQRLAQTGHTISAQALGERRLALGTPGEVLQSSCAILLDLRQRCPAAYAMVENEAEAVLAYAMRIG